MPFGTSSARGIVTTAVLACCLLLPAAAWAKEEAIPDKQAEFLPIVKKAKYSSRNTIDVTARSAEDLKNAGFAKIGLAEVKIVRRRCKGTFSGAKCEDVPTKGDAMADLLRTAAKGGGDLVVLIRDREEEQRFNEGKKCVSWQTNYGYRYVQNYATGLADLVWGPMGQTCSRYEKFTTAHDLEVSVAEVWRNEPGLAEKIRLIEDFILAAGTGDMATVQKALDGGIDVNKTTDSEGSLPLSRAALMGQEEMVAYLISRGAKVNAYDRIASPLYQAVFGGHLEVVKLLLEKGANPNAKLPESERTVMFAGAESGSTEIIAELLKRKAKADPKDKSGITPLMLAAGNGHAGAVRALLAAGAKVDNRMTAITSVAARWTALHFAAFGGHAEAVRALLEGGAEHDLEDYYSNKPLELARLMAVAGEARSGEAAADYRRTVRLLTGYGTGYYGAIDEDWNIVIPLRFADVGVFSEGLAAAEPANSVDGRYGYIDRSGVFVIKPRFVAAFPFREGLAAVSERGRWGRTYDWVGYGFIDKKGRYFRAPDAETTKASSFSDGLAPIAIGGRYGYLDKAGTLAIEPRFSWAGVFSNGQALVRVKAEGDKEEKYGIIDRGGRFVIEPRFERDNWAVGGLQLFAEGLAAAHFGKGKWGYIDMAGRTVIEPAFREAGPFSGGLAAVLGRRGWGFIDKAGSWVIEPQFHYVSLGGGFSEDLCAVEMKKGKWGYVDRSGNVVIEPVYEYAGPFESGRAAVKIDGLYGLIDRTGQMVVNPRFSEVGRFLEGLAPARIRGRAFLENADMILAELEK